MLNIKNLKTTFKVSNKTVTAVDDMSIQIPEQKTIGLVGESGSGKSVTALSIMKLLPPSANCTGEIKWKGKNILDYSEKEMRCLRGSELGLIFQNPLSALNPVFTIGNQLIETICLHQKIDKVTARKEAISLLTKVNIPDPDTRLHQYPHQFSLGMCQRVMIALTLAMSPTLLIADEPSASLDVTVQAQIMRLLKNLKSDYKMSVLLISHDLGLISENCDYIYVMYLGKIVEEGSPQQIFTSPLHPYTQALINAIPNPNPDKQSTYIPLEGDIPSPLDIPKGCRFHTRCPKVMPECKTKCPKLKAHQNAKVACFLYE
ncbi:peptide ABC transporter ATP-binding protein [Candidatus Marinamargulisbacteria bacterium SCGC AG-439-L15]|nr:peptide ABC transporter ATP-binding protein [Candidatus Marinamargulisbacteria bacterium SCGC AG-439-L15]